MLFEWSKNGLLPWTAVIENPLALCGLIVDIPHAGRLHPGGARHGVPPPQPNRSDVLCDLFFEPLANVADCYIWTMLSRQYVDLNKAVSPGKGVLRTTLGQAERMPVDLEEFGHAYRCFIKRQCGVLRTRYDQVIHLNLHSFRARKRREHDLSGLPTVYVGDVNGLTADRSLGLHLVDALNSAGFVARYNEEFCGGSIVRAVGEPASGFHSLQIEIRRDLYLNETETQLGDYLDSQLRFLSAVKDWLGAVT